MASGFNKVWPLLEIMTGSTTRLKTSWGFNIFATVSTMGVDDNMPVLTAAISKSSKTASIWAAITEGGTSKTAVTSSVFWAVMAVMTDIANTPLADMALMSA